MSAAGTKSAGRPKSSTPKRGGIVGKKRGTASSAGASARPAKKPKKTAEVARGTYATIIAGVARNLFGPTRNETALKLTANTLLKHKDHVKARYENCKDLLAISRSHNRDLAEKLSCSEHELALAIKHEAALKEVIQELHEKKDKYVAVAEGLNDANNQIIAEKETIINGLRAEKAVLVQTNKDLGEANHKLEYVNTVQSSLLRDYQESERRKTAAARVARMLE